MSKKSSVVWLLLLTAIVVAACNASGGDTAEPSDSGNAPGNSSESTGGTSEAPAAEAMGRTLDISYVSDRFAGAVEGDWVEQQLNGRMNIKLKDVKVDIHDPQQVDLMLASGEMPDAAWLFKSPLDLYTQGVTRTIPRDMIETYAPSYAEMLSRYPIGWRINQSKDNPDEYMGLTGMYEEPVPALVSYYRLDWLEKLGIRPNGTLEQIDDAGRIWVTDEPFTQSQLNAILQAFTFDDPDGNGQNDTHGLTGSEYTDYTWASIEGMFGFSDCCNVLDGGKTVEWFASSQYKEFLKYANGLYEAGVVDKEFVTLDWNKWNEKLAAGRSGYFTTSSYYLNPSFIDRAPNNILNNNPEAKILVAPPEAGDSGLTGTMLYWQAYTYNLFIGSQVDDEKLIRILQLVEYMYFDKEAQLYTRFGEEGVNWNWSGEPFRSAPKLIEGSPKTDYYNGNYMTPKELTYLSRDALTEKLFGYALNDWAKDGVLPHRHDQFLETDYDAVNKEVGPALATIHKEFMFKVITGELDVDAEWDGYIRRLNDAGLVRLHEELNKAPLTSELFSVE